MNVGNISKIILSAIVAIVIFAALLVPVVNDSTHEYRIGLQDESEYTYHATTEIGGTYSVVDSHLYFNGVEIGSTTTNAISNCFRMIYNGSAIVLFDVNVGAVGNVTELKINPDGTYAYTVGDITTSGLGVVTDFIGVADEGDYVYSYGSTAVLKVDPTSTIYAIPSGQLSNGTVTLNPASVPMYLTYAKGTVDELQIDSAYIRLTGSTYTETTATMEIVSTPSEEGYSTIGTQGGNVSVGEYSSSNCAYILFVPEEYHYLSERSGSEFTLLAIIPIVVLVGIVLALIREFSDRD